ncbi:MAG TPA: metalloregulator ArsR/SmtB family transcription factor [Candidatus Bathyarchaeia archaeon]|nr:metalloregulator ArsR/SmtB family transcription factor [Candidatus Bathyarchaeia archaeon]
MAPKSDTQRRLKARVFYALSDPIRIEILEFIRDGEKCVCEIVPHLNLIQPVVSRHLKLLKDSGLVVDRKVGNKRLYSITFPEIYTILDDVNPELASALSKKIMEQMIC